MSNLFQQSLKSYIFLAYIMLTERCDRFKKWASKKAYAVLNCTEIVFWAVPMGLSASGAARSCDGVSCAAAIVLILLCLVLM